MDEDCESWSLIEIIATGDGQECLIEENGRVNITSNVNVTRCVTYTVINQSSESIQFVSYRHGYRQNQVTVAIYDQHNVKNGKTCELVPSDTCWVKINLTGKEPCGTNIRIRFTLATCDGQHFDVTREINLDCIVDDGKKHYLFSQLAPNNTPGADDDDDDDEHFDDLHLIEFPGYQHRSESEGGLERTLWLAEYPIPDYVMQMMTHFIVTGAVNIDFVQDTLNIRYLSYDNYDEYFNSMLYLEEIQLQRDVRHYTIRNGTLFKDRNPDKEGNTRFRAEIPGLAEKRPSVLRGDRLHVTPLPPVELKYEGLVNDTSHSNAYLVFDPRFEVDVGDVFNKVFRIEFTIQRLSLRLMHRAVEIMKSDQLYEDILFPQSFNIRPMKPINSFTLDCFEKSIEGNSEQITAVRHIVAGSSRPAPYIIYGPPGTGKTFTLVEAIKQVCKVYPKSKILVCAPQNDAADIIAERLLDHVSEKSILRFNAASRNAQSMSEEILRISNYNQVLNRVVFSPKSEIAKKQIVVSTLTNSGRLVSAELNDHFTHLFIDEAGFATEPETVIPLALLSPKLKMGGQLVLAGDPKQLGPILRSALATLHGFDVSLLERLMEAPNSLYSRNQDGFYNNKFVTKLLKNFRSHPEILEVPNQLFYEFELQPCADKREREKLCGWQGLPEFSMYRWKFESIGFPLVFRQVTGREEQDRSSPSWFNRHEVLVVAEYVENLLYGSPRVDPLDIGIISPYIQQVKKIRRALDIIGNDPRSSSISGDIRDIKVGSVEKFQGDEKEVIIISTVRSQTDKLNIDEKFNLGFVRNPKRFNVAMTRAKSLLVLIGNPFVLCTDEKWRRMIAHIVQGGGYLGEELSEELLRIEPDEESKIRQAGVSNQQFMAEKERRGRSDYLLHHDDQWEHRDV